MSTINFQAKISLVNAVGDGSGGWELDLGFFDAEGVNTPYAAKVGDVIVIDTAAYQPGTMGFFTVNNIVSKTFNSIKVDVSYLGSPGTSPDLTWVIGAEGIISRPTPNLKLLPVISADVQKTIDKYSFYTLNYNLSKVLDSISPSSGGSNAVRLYTAKRVPYEAGIGANIPHLPLGDFVNNTAVLHLKMGAAIEVMDITMFTDENGFYYVKLDDIDDLQYGADVESVTVSYLIEESQA